MDYISDRKYPYSKLCLLIRCLEFLVDDITTDIGRSIYSNNIHKLTPIVKKLNCSKERLESYMTDHNLEYKRTYLEEPLLRNNEIIVECCIGIQLNLYEYQLIYAYLNYPTLQTSSMLYKFAVPLIKEISELIAKHSSSNSMLYSID